jgi:hypothetical protein
MTVYSFTKRLLKHKYAFLKVEKELTGKMSLKGLLHDVDKFFLFLLYRDKSRVQVAHRQRSSHHIRDNRIKDITSAIIDWESSRYTKPEAPLSAREYYESLDIAIDGMDSELLRLKL